MTAEHDLPIVRACQVARLSRAAYYKPGMDRMARDAEVIAALQAIVVDEQRWGFWKCHDRLRALGHGWNHKRVWRVYCLLRLNLPRRTRRRVPHRERQPLLVEPRMNAVWALDLMRDTLYSGRVFRTLNVIDEANRGALGIDIAVSIPAARVIAFLTQMIDLHDRPSAIRCDNGPELTSQTFTDWCKQQDIELRFIQPGKPDQNAYIERFNRTYREEVLSAYLFDSLNEVREITVEWIERYNEIRPHDALGSLPPARYREQLIAAELQFRTVYLTGKLTGGVLSRDTFAQRFNVAASRARDRMYLVRSVEANQLSDADRLRRSLIHHFSVPFAQDEMRVEDLRKLCESPFERDVYDDLTGRGYWVVPQVPVGQYRIDMVVQGHSDARLAIECDGDKYHGPEKWADDMQRQRVLERAGWVFWRCFASTFLRRRHEVIEDLLRTLNDRGVEPIGAEGAPRSVHTEQRRFRALEAIRGE